MGDSVDLKYSPDVGVWKKAEPNTGLYMGQTVRRTQDRGNDNLCFTFFDHDSSQGCITETARPIICTDGRSSEEKGKEREVSLEEKEKERWPECDSSLASAALRIGNKITQSF